MQDENTRIEWWKFISDISVSYNYEFTTNKGNFSILVNLYYSVTRDFECYLNIRSNTNELHRTILYFRTEDLEAFVDQILKYIDSPNPFGDEQLALSRMLCMVKEEGTQLYARQGRKGKVRLYIEKNGQKYFEPNIMHVTKRDISRLGHWLHLFKVDCEKLRLTNLIT